MQTPPDSSVTYAMFDAVLRRVEAGAVPTVSALPNSTADTMSVPPWAITGMPSCWTPVPSG